MRTEKEILEELKKTKSQMYAYTYEPKLQEEYASKVRILEWVINKQNKRFNV